MSEFSKERQSEIKKKIQEDEKSRERELSERRSRQKTAFEAQFKSSHVALACTLSTLRNAAISRLFSRPRFPSQYKILLSPKGKSLARIHFFHEIQAFLFLRVLAKILSLSFPCFYECFQILPRLIFVTLQNR